MRADRPGAITQWDEMTVNVYTASPASQCAQHMHAKRFQQGLGRLEPLCWVMISCRHHDLQLGIYAQKTGDGGIEQSLRFARWIDAVKHIACNKEHVNALGHNHIT